MTHTANTSRTNIAARAVPLAAFAALLVVLASADAAMRAPAPRASESMDGRLHARASSLGFGRLVEGLLACATVPDEGAVAQVETSAVVIASPAEAPSIPAGVFGLATMTDLPPPTLG